MARFNGWWMSGVMACCVLAALPAVAQEDPGVATAASRLAIRDAQNIMAMGTGFSLARPTMDFHAAAADAGQDGTLDSFQIRAIAVDPDDYRGWELDFQPATPIRVGTTQLVPANGAHIIGTVPVGNGYMENECTGTGTLTVTDLEVNETAPPGLDVVQRIAGSFSFDCRVTFGDRTGIITGEFFYERLAAGDGDDDGDDGDDDTPPPPPPPFQVVLPTIAEAEPLLIDNAGSATIRFDTAIDATFSSDLNLSVVTTAAEHENLRVSIAPSLIPAPGSGSGTITVTAGPNTTPQRYTVTVFATAGEQTTSTSFVVEIQCTPPFILGIDQPKSIAGIPSGTQTTLEVKPGGSGPFSYQWYRGMPGMTNSPVQAENNAKLIFTARESGPYWVRVRNACGSVDSAAAMVTVNPQPVYSRRGSRP